MKPDSFRKMFKLYGRLSFLAKEAKVNSNSVVSVTSEVVEDFAEQVMDVMDVMVVESPEKEGF